MRVYLVGGAVRDALLGLPVKDKDFVVVGADFDDMTSLGFVQVGADFPVFLHPNTHHEYALARIERKNGQGYQGFATQTKGVSLADDLLRRDLTINALAIEVVGLFDDTPITGQVIDFYGGLEDLKSKTLRHVSPAFGEDPLRILRTVRFLARYQHLGFAVADETVGLIQTMACNGELLHLSRERLWGEAVKAMESGTGHLYWQALKALKILPHFLKALDECWQDDAIFYTVIDRLHTANKCSVAVQFAMLCSGYLGDDDLQISLIKQTAHALNTPKHPVHIAHLLTEFHDSLNKPNAKNILRLIEKTKAHQGGVQVLEEVLHAISIVQVDLKMACIHELLNNAVNAYKSVSINDVDNNLTGKDIGIALNQQREHKVAHLLGGLS